MNKKRNIYILDNNLSYGQWIYDHNIVENPHDADIIIFTGGADVSPFFYDEYEKHPQTYSDTNRDVVELDFYKKFKDKFKIGICRGAQFLNVMNGGKLIQDCNNHHSSHYITLKDGGSKMKVSSDHHQMVIPNTQREDFELLGWSDKLSKYYKNGKNENIKLPEDYKEFELGIYKKTNDLLIQSHPEWMEETSEFVNYLNYLINKIWKI